MLIASRRRCAICYGLVGDYGEKKGQIAHIDRNPANSVDTNLVFLCLPHHDKYDSKTSQSKGYIAQEVWHYRAELYKFVKKAPPESWQSSTRPRIGPTAAQGQIASIEMYEKRIQVYRTAKGFIAKIVREANPQFDDLLSFIQGVDEATFLFDEAVYEYLNELYRKAVRLRYIHGELQRQKASTPVVDFASEESDILVWFTDQFSKLKSHLVPYFQWE